MKIKIFLSLLAAALLPACTSTQTTSRDSDANSSRYANDSIDAETAPPAEGPAEADIPSEGPPSVASNPAYIPTPLLRRSAATGP